MLLNLDEEDFQLLELAQTGVLVEVRIGTPLGQRVSRLRLAGLIDTGPVRDGSQMVTTSEAGYVAVERREWERAAATLDYSMTAQPGSLSELRQLMRTVLPRVQVNRTETPLLLEIVTPTVFSQQERSGLLKWLDDNLPLNFTYRLTRA